MILREFLGNKVYGTTLPEREEERLGRAGRTGTYKLQYRDTVRFRFSFSNPRIHSDRMSNDYPRLALFFRVLFVEMCKFYATLLV